MRPLIRALILAALAVWAASLAPGVALAQEGQAASCTAEEIDRVTVEARGELMASCCWKNTLLNHSSPKADQHSAEVRRLAEQCYTKQQILDHFTEKYGESILARPAARGLGLWFYLGPVLILLATGVWLAVRVVPRLVGAPSEPPPSPGPPSGERRESGELDGAFEAELRRHNA